MSERLGISRGTTIRVLNEARERGEIQIWIAEDEAAAIALGAQLEKTLGIDEAIVVPAAASSPDFAKAVGMALGKFLSEALTDNMTVGIGWGRTLMASLASLRPARHTGMKIVSLLGGIVETRGSNPLEVSWRMANQFGADCYLFVAPAFVDSVETKERLIDKCGLDRVFHLARALDVVVLSAGDISANATSLSAKIITPRELSELLELGCVCDVLCNFLDADGQSIDHEVNRRVMSVDLDGLRSTGHIVIATGGAHRAQAIRSAIRRIGCNTLVTDEPAARALLELVARDTSS